MFVVNELVQQDRVKAMETLGQIVAGMRKGAFLLVIDSFSNMSDVQVGGKTHRVHTLLDHLKGLRKATGAVRVFGRIFAHEAAIGMHAFALLEALPCVWTIPCLSKVHFLTGIL
jgi:hypothetical protein